VSPRGRPSRRQRAREQARPSVAEERSFEVTAAGERLDKLVAARFPDLSRARVQQLIAAALVDVDGGPRRPPTARGPAPGSASACLRLPRRGWIRCGSTFRSFTTTPI